MKLWTNKHHLALIYYIIIDELCDICTVNWTCELTLKGGKREGVTCMGEVNPSIFAYACMDAIFGQFLVYANFAFCFWLSCDGIIGMQWGWWALFKKACKLCGEATEVRADCLCKYAICFSVQWRKK